MCRIAVCKGCFFTGKGEPGGAVGRLDAIPVSPVVSRVLNIIHENELIHIGHLFEITQPRQINGL